MKGKKRLLTFLLALALVCGLAVPASADGVPSAAAGETVIHDSGGYTHTLSNPILYTFKLKDFYDVPSFGDTVGDIFWRTPHDYSDEYDVYAVPVGTVIHADKNTCFWDCMGVKMEYEAGGWLRNYQTSSEVLVTENDGVPEFTFSKSGVFYRCYFTFKNNHALYTDTIYIYTPGTDAAYGAPDSYKQGAGSGSVPSPGTPAPGVKESPVAADPRAEASGTDNNGLWNFKRYGAPVKSYLYPRSDGLLTRVEFFGSSDAVIEVYDQNFQLLSTKKILGGNLMKGGFFAGADYNFLIYGQKNPYESDSQEVIRVMKYSKDWELLGSASLKGANTTVPFDAGSLRCAEHNGFLYIRTCHEMYKSNDGLNHQANMTLVVRQSDMAVVYKNYGVGGSGYVSHSFNQFIIAGEDGTIVTLDHGDAYPRAAVLYRYQNRTDGILEAKDSVQIQKFPGKIGENETNASLGGLTESSTHYLAAGNLGTSPTSTRDIMLYAVSKTDFSQSSLKTVKLTNYTGTGQYGATPQIVKISDNRFLLMWGVQTPADDGLFYIDADQEKLSYVFIDGSGSPIGQIQTVTAKCSGCEPILYNGKVVWYGGDSFEKPTFYALDASTGALASRKIA